MAIVFSIGCLPQNGMKRKSIPGFPRPPLCVIMDAKKRGKRYYSAKGKIMLMR